MMKRTAGAVAEIAGREALAKPKVIGVTLLTSLDQKSLERIGFSDDPHSMVARLARSAAECGLDGVVASPQEIGLIRQTVSTPKFLIVTPGIRSSNDAGDDQRRTLTSAEAIKAGADYLVVGRPILNAKDPVDAAGRVVAEITDALRQLNQPL